ncbi:MAG: carboxyltransferase domain-containing protein [Thermoanaerobaculia bacterium]
MPGIRFLPSADDALLVSFETIGFDDLHALVEEARAIEGVVAAIAGQSSILVLGRDASVTGAIRASIEAILLSGIAPRPLPDSARHELAVDFSAEHAPDLGMLLERAAMPLEALLSRIASLELRARYLGFLPGFAYLEGWPEEWSLPRRSVVRERVPAGSLGIAGAMAGFYPGESPGGWNIVGRSGATLWDPRAARPNLIAPGDVVTIRPGAFVAARASSHEPDRVAEPLAEVLAPGVATIVAGEAAVERYAFGIAPGGAFDAPSMRFANRLAENDDGALLVECAALGPRLRFMRDCAIAIAGAEVEATIDGVRVPIRTRLDVARGSILDVGPVRGGMRAVVAVRGGLTAVEPRWSVRPRRLAKGDAIYRADAEERRLPLLPPPRGDRLTIEAYAGPHELDATLLDHIVGRQWTVTPSLDRTGVRLASGPAPAELPALLPSCGMRSGTVQWHPGGELVVMGPDHPITGGYLQPLTVPRREMWKVAQLAPGDLARFQIVER